MNRIGWTGIAILLTSLASAQERPVAKSDVRDAAKKLAGSSYGWTSTCTTSPESGPTEGKSEKNGDTWVKSKMGEAFLKDGKCAVKSADGWKTLGDFGRGEDPQGRSDPAELFAKGLRRFMTPAVLVAGLVEKAGDLKDDGSGAIAGDLTETGVKEILSGHREGPYRVVDGKGWVKLWLKDGSISKCEYNVTGKWIYDQRPIPINITTVIEIKDLDKAKVEIPLDAKKTLEKK